jgi:hypothetical protein
MQMRVIYSAAVLMAGLFAATGSHAFTSEGTIESVNPAGNEIRIVNGDAYRLPQHVDVTGLKPGQRVQVTWENQQPSTINVGGEYFIRSLTATGVSTVR